MPSPWTRDARPGSARPLSSAALEAIEIGRAHEAALHPDVRRRGAHFTPAGAAAVIADLALGAWGGRGLPRVLDPAAGAGALLVAVADRLADGGAEPDRVLGVLRGVELDPATVRVADDALGRWASGRAGPPTAPTGPGASGRVVEVGDGLALGDHGADVVVANPPFGGQRRRHTARSATDNAALRGRLGAELVDLTADTAAVFLVAACVGLAAGGVAAVLQPRPVLATAGAAGVRRALAGSVRGVWLPGTVGFDADVEVGAVVAGRPDEARSDPVRVWTGAAAEQESRVERQLIEGATWAALVVVADGVPPLGPVPPGRLRDVAETASGFRDEYYALVAAVVEGRPGGAAAPLWTTAHVDPGRSWWGSRPVRIGGRRWASPWVDLDRLAVSASPRVSRWVTARRVPKVVVASQTRVIEAVADLEGTAVPLTPLVSVTSDVVGPAALVAALTAPPATVWAHHHHGAAGRARGALRLAGRELLGVPLPSAAHAWSEMAARLAAGPGDRASWRAVGRLGCRAWGWDGDVAEGAVEWWLDRLPAIGA